jgi:hypothetical protein
VRSYADWAWWHVPVILVIWEAQIRTIVVHASLGKNRDLTSKITREKRAGDMVQVVGVPTMHEVLSST